MRYRYIGFIIKSFDTDLTIEKYEMINEIRMQCKQLFNKNLDELGIRLIRFDGKKGIVKCYNIEKEPVIKLLKSIKKVISHDIIIETLGTSGTIKSLIKKHMNC